MNNSIMCHLVAGYPSESEFVKLIDGFDRIGVSYLEIQIPFSDPIADGESIMHANDITLENGMTLEKSFKLINRISKSTRKNNIFVMTYIQKIYFYGVENFCNKLAEAHCIGIIVPDLPYDTKEFDGLLKATRKFNINLVPVISPGILSDRLHDILLLKPKYLYLTSQRGITGNKYASSSELHALTKLIKQKSDAHIFIGFGITDASDVADALKVGDTAVIGSTIIRQLETTTIDDTLTYITNLIDAPRAR